MRGVRARGLLLFVSGCWVFAQNPSAAPVPRRRISASQRQSVASSDHGDSHAHVASNSLTLQLQQTLCEKRRLLSNSTTRGLANAEQSPLLSGFNLERQGNHPWSSRLMPFENAAGVRVGARTVKEKDSRSSLKLPGVAWSCLALCTRNGKCLSASLEFETQAGSHSSGHPQPSKVWKASEGPVLCQYSAS